MSGYAGVDFNTWENFDWAILKQYFEEIIDVAKKLNTWIVIGSTYSENTSLKPTNCIYIISNNGKIVSRYDKRMLTINNIQYYSPGKEDAIQIFNIHNVTFGVLICYDSSFQEMFDGYKKANVGVILLSLYNARNKGKSFLDEITLSMIRTRAVDNDMWIIANNSSAPYSNWPTCIASPDGRIVQKLPRHKGGVLYHEFPDHNYKKWRIKWECSELSI